MGIEELKIPKKKKEELIYYIKSLQKEREVALKALNEYLNNQEKSHIFTKEFLCLGEEQGPSLKINYIQSKSKNIYFSFDDIILNVSVKDDGIYLQWYGEDYYTQELSLVPLSFQQAKITNKKYMR